MREGIHPDYLETTVVCSCGERFVTHTTKGGELHVELCSKCHPFYTGTQKLVDSGGRVQRFADKFGDAAQAVRERETAEREARQKVAEETAEAARKEREEREAAKAAKRAEAEKAAEAKAAKDEARKARKEAAAAAAIEDEPVSVPGEAAATEPEAAAEPEPEAAAEPEPEAAAEPEPEAGDAAPEEETAE